MRPTPQPMAVRPADALAAPAPTARSRWPQRLSLLATGFCLGALVTFAVLETRRQNQPQPALLPAEQTKQVARTAALPNLTDPAAFAAFNAKVRARHLAMDERYQALQHRWRQKTTQQDGAGATLSAEETVTLVRMIDRKESKRRLSLKDLVTGKTVEGDSALQQELAARRQEYFYPYSKQEGPADFAYAFDGYEEVAGRTLAKVGFTALKPFGNKLSGHSWADPATGDIVRMRGLLAAPTFPVERLEMVFEYGLAENGAPQLRKVLTDGAGGALFFKRRMLVEIDIDDYRTP